MSLLQHYIWRQVLIPLTIILSALTGLALLTQSLSTIDLVVENRQSAVTFLYITILALPQLVAIILPLAVFMSVLYALNRLNVDSELVVAKSVGTSPWSISSPVMRVATCAMIVHLVINLLIQPLSFREMRKELLSVRTDIASQMMRPGEFSSPISGLTVFARDLGAQGSMEDVLIRDSRSPRGARIYTANSGVVKKIDDQVWLVLENGMIQDMTPEGALQPITFEIYQLDLSGNITFDSVLRLKSSDRFLHELLYSDPREYGNTQFRNTLYAEGHSRLATPLYCLALAALALAFLARGKYQKMGYGRRIAVCAALGFTIRLSGFAASSAAESHVIYNSLQYGIPVVVTLICLVYLLVPFEVRFFRQKPDSVSA